MSHPSERGAGALGIVLILIIGIAIGFYLRPEYEKRYGNPSTEKIGAQVGRSIDDAIDKTGNAIEKVGDKIDEKLDK